MYLGRSPTIGTQRLLDSIESQFNGALTTFDLRYGGVPTYPTLSESLIVSLGGVLQEPSGAYYVSSDKIVFSEAPATGSECWIMLYSQYGASTSSVPSLAIQATGEPMGFENRTHSTISFASNTRTFSIAPNTAAGHSSYAVWTKGTRRTYSVAQSVQIGTTTGLYYIYFDAFGVLQSKTTYFTWDTETPVAYVYWNSVTGSAPFIADERHGIVLDWATHEYLHRTRGAVIAEGFSISAYTTAGDGSADAHAQFDLGNGTFFDEDLEVAISHSATPTVGTFTQVLTGAAELPVFYLSGSSGDWVRDTPTKYACKQSGTTLQYNSLTGSTWSTTPATNNRYVVSWVVATNDINAPIIAILGQEEYTAIGSAEEVKFGDLVLTNFPIVEFRPLWKVVFQTSTSFTNTPNARVANVLDLRQLSETGEAGTVVSDHGLLSGLADDDHSQYLHTALDRAGVSADISTTGGISAASLSTGASGVGVNINNAGLISGPATITLDPATVGDDSGLVEIKGNLTVQGLTTTINSTTLDLDHLSLGDNEVANFGASDDLKIYHNATDNYFDTITTGKKVLFRMSNSTSLDTNALTITKEGSVGIGIIDPTYKLTIDKQGISDWGAGLKRILSVDNNWVYSTFRTPYTVTTTTHPAGWYNIVKILSWDFNVGIHITFSGDFTADQIDIEAKSSWNAGLNNSNAGPHLRVNRTMAHNGNRLQQVRIGYDIIGNTYIQAYLNLTFGAAGAVKVAVVDKCSAWADTVVKAEPMLTTATSITVLNTVNLANTAGEYYNLNGVAGDFVWGTNATERLRITSTGTLNFVGAGIAGSTQAVSLSGTAPVNSLVLDSSGRVGIGIFAPSTSLNVHGTISTGRNLAREFGTVIDYSSQYSGGRGSASNVIGGLINFEDGSNDWLTAANQVAGAYVTIDLGAPRTVMRAVIYNQNEYSTGDREVKEFRIQGSSDNSSWTTIIDSELGMSRGEEPNPGWTFRIPGIIGDDNEGTTYRYWKFIIDSTHIPSTFAGLTEIELYDDDTNVQAGGYSNAVVTSGVFTQDLTSESSSIGTLNIGSGYGNSSTTDGNLLVKGNVGIGTTNPQYKLEVNGSFAATTKSFVIPHPTKEGYKLQHGSLEGPENGVYVRGRSGSGVIKLPGYWAGLIDPSSITVTLTPIGQNASLWVERIESNKIYIGREDPSVAYFYMVNAERIDVEPLKVEIPNPS